MRTTINLPDEALELARSKADEGGLTLGEVIGRAIVETYRERPARVSRKRRPMPISSTSGGLLPGIDLDDRSTYDHLLGDRI